jgi:hypothetical protein
MTALDDATFDLILCSPPFLALRSYLPDGHPDKAKEIGSESTPAEFLDTLLELTAEWGRLLAPHGSIAVELGDTYAGSGGAGGDYDPDGLRDGQPRFRQVGSREHRSEREGTGADGGDRTVPLNGGPGWPLDKSLACIPQLYQVALAYGINPLTGRESPAGRWRVRNLKPWIRSNPPVGALGDKERPATSYVIVATRARDRWFDLDAVRTTHTRPPESRALQGPTGRTHADQEQRLHGANIGGATGVNGFTNEGNAAGAPPRDWWHHVDAVLDNELAQRTGPERTSEQASPKTNGQGRGGGWSTLAETGVNRQTGAQGVHLRRALEHAGILTTQEALDVSPRGYSGAHYAVWPPELVRLLVDEMCPRRVCLTCGLPSRRIVGEATYVNAKTGTEVNKANWIDGERQTQGAIGRDNGSLRVAQTLGWSDCGHNTWRPGRILDPFVGSGTTLAVATGMGRDAVGIDIDERNALLAAERVGMFLTVNQREVPA